MSWKESRSCTSVASGHGTTSTKEIREKSPEEKEAKEDAEELRPHTFQVCSPCLVLKRTLFFQLLPLAAVTFIECLHKAAP